MKTHLIFCCNDLCKRYMIGQYMENNASIIHNRDMVILNGKRYKFFIDVNTNPWVLCGLSFIDFSVCEHYFISQEVRAILRVRLNDQEEREYGNIMRSKTDIELIDAFNQQVGNRGWASSRATYLQSIVDEIKRRGFDYSAIDCDIGISFARKIILIDNKIYCIEEQKWSEIEDV